MPGDGATEETGNGRCRGEETSGLPLEVFDPSPVGVLVTEGKEHRLVYLNDALRAMFGDRPLGTPVREAFSNLLQQDSLSLFDRVLETGEAVRRDQATARVACPSGGSQERFFHYSLSKIPLPGGKSGVLQVIVEVTEQFVATRRMRTLAREQRRLLRRYQSLIWVNAHTVWVSDPSGRFREVSPDWKKMTGQTREEYRGYGWLQVVHPEDRASIMDAWLRAAEEVPPLIEQVFRVRVLDGTYRHFRLRAVPVCKDGAVVEWVGASTEIEQEWQENRCRKLLDRAAAAVADITDLEEMFQALADVIVPELADACHIHLLPELADSFSDVFVTERIATAVRAGLRECSGARRPTTPPTVSSCARYGNAGPSTCPFPRVSRRLTTTPRPGCGSPRPGRTARRSSRSSFKARWRRWWSPPSAGTGRRSIRPTSS